MNRLLTVAVAGIAALAFANGCQGAKSEGPVETCTKVAEQCKLPNGPLGVCNLVTCAPGQASPCLKCVSQH